MVDFYHREKIDKVKLGCTLLNLAINCHHTSTTAKLCLFIEIDNHLLEKRCEDMVFTTIFTRNAAGDKIIQNSLKPVKNIIGIEASQLYP